tara:strand:+ start:10534 stop:11781 length:1248 start_codon:yes stop_codon:yes gene_type:complete
MSDRLKTLREKRGKLATDMRAITDKAASEKRDLTTEEVTAHSAIFDQVDSLRGQITAEERQIEVDRESAETELHIKDDKENRGKGKPADPTLPTETDKRAMTAFSGFLRNGQINGEGAEELRALQASSDPEGGFLVAPQTFVAQLIQAMDNAVFIRSKATTIPLVKAESMGVPTLDTDLNDADWTPELGTGSEDTAMRFGKRELRPHPLAKRIKVSKKLLRISALPIDTIVLNRLAYKFGVTFEKACMTGDGNKKPLGLFTPSNDGIPTSRDVATDNTSTAITFDGLINAKYSVKSGYWPKSEWVFHRDAVKQLTKIKDLEGQYIWRDGVKAGEPDRLLNAPINMSEYAPNTFTTGLYVGLFGDLSTYWIADALDLQIQRLTELYAETNQDGFIGRMESDGAPTMGEAFVRVKLG